MDSSAPSLMNIELYILLQLLKLTVFKVDLLARTQVKLPLVNLGAEKLSSLAFQKAPVVEVLL
jgi:hypothetical protein